MQKLEKAEENQSFENLTFEIGKTIEKLLHSGFEAPLHWATISVNGCVLAGCYAVSGEGLVCKITTQYLPQKIFICPLNMMVVDSKGLAALISISKSKQTKVLFH